MLTGFGHLTNDWAVRQALETVAGCYLVIVFAHIVVHRKVWRGSLKVYVVRFVVWVVFLLEYGLALYYFNMSLSTTNPVYHTGSLQVRVANLLFDEHFSAYAVLWPVAHFVVILLWGLRIEERAIQ